MFVFEFVLIVLPFVFHSFVIASCWAPSFVDFVYFVFVGLRFPKKLFVGCGGGSCRFRW